jgi:uncharacterized protein
MDFEWDPRKDAANERKHGVGFREATTILGDPLATTFPDIEHSASERRFLTIGASVSDRVLVVVHTERQEAIRIISEDQQLRTREDSMKRNSERPGNGDIRPEYDFSAMKGGVRGKYYRQYRKGTNVVMLEPDIAKAFPTEDAVNEALRDILFSRQAMRRTSGLSDRARRTTAKGQKRSGRG